MNNPDNNGKQFKPSRYKRERKIFLYILREMTYLAAILATGLAGLYIIHWILEALP